MKNLIIILSVVFLFACNKEKVEPKKTTKTIVIEATTTTGTLPMSFKIYVNDIEKSSGSNVGVGIKEHFDYEGNSNDIVKVQLYNNSNNKHLVITVEGSSVVNQTSTDNPFIVTTTIH